MDALKQNRANMYQFLSYMFAGEVDLEDVQTLLAMQDMAAEDEHFLRLHQYLQEYQDSCVTDLAEDFARVFLGAGLAGNEAAYPYASVYTSKNRIVKQEIWASIKEEYRKSGYELTEAPCEFMEDHIACQLEYMSLLCQKDEKKQAQFLENFVLNWIPVFCADIKKTARTDFYRGLADWLEAYVKADYEFLINSAEKSAESISVFVPADRMKQIFEQLIVEYDIYAPAKKTETDGGSLRYRKVLSPEEIDFGRQSDFSPKEVYYPVSQTMLSFTEEEVSVKEINTTRKKLIFMRSCDIHGLKRLDRIFLENGNEDYYYSARRKDISIALMECKKSGDDCFCVSMKTNETKGYDLAVRADQSGYELQITNKIFYPYFAKETSCAFVPEFVKENKRTMPMKPIQDHGLLKKIAELDFWKQFDEKCISCGGCNTVCGSCSCFDTLDITYDELGKEGERRRIWSSCMLGDFTTTAGGGCVRKTPAEAMRFKTFHKLYDYSMRFEVEETMCVGCGRCVRKCPQEIDFLDTITKLQEEIREVAYEE